MRVETRGEHTLIEFESQDEDGDDWDEAGEEWMPSLLPLREDLLAGDLRSLYLGWLAAARSGDLDDDVREPPVPAGLGKLSAPLKALAKFLRLDEDLIAVAAEASGPQASAPAGVPRDEVAAYVRAMPAAEKDALLLRLAEAGDTTPRIELLRRFRADRKKAAPKADPPGGRRTAGQLLTAADTRAEERRRREAERKAKAAERRAKEEAAAREIYLEELAGRVDRAWGEVEAMIATKQQPEYDRAVTLLKDLRDVSERQGSPHAFYVRLAEIRHRHAKKSTLIERLGKAGLTPPHKPAAT